MHRLRSALLVSVVVLGLTTAVRAQDPKPGASAAAVTSAIAMFSKLDLPSVKGRRFVKLNTGESWESEGKLHFRYTSGWLLEEKPDEVELLSAGLVRRRFKRDRTLPPGWEKHAAMHPKELPLPGELADVDFDKAAGELASGPTDRYFGFDAMDHSREGGLSRHGEACLFAFWEHQRGNDALASKLEDLAARAGEAFVKDARSSEDEGKTPPRIDELIAYDVAVNLRWRAINLANEGAPRSELVSIWKTIASLEAAGLRDEASAMLGAYASFDDEDAKWRGPTASSVDGSAPVERARFWMRALRDHSARQRGQPGGVSVLGKFAGLPKDRRNAADELAKLGWDAVPALIDGLTDRRPTRCMGYWRDFAPGSFYLLTIGDCCQQIFETITGEEIYKRTTTSGAMTKDGAAVAAQKFAREWWEKVKGQSERDFLVESVSSGSEEGAGRAARLVERFPDAALAALKEGVAHSKHEGVRAYLVSVASELEKDDPTSLLEAETATDRAMPVRIAATRGLLKRGRRDVLPPMIQAWREGKGDPQSLLALLVDSCDEDAILALGEDFATKPLELRNEILIALRGRSSSPGEKDPAREKAYLDAIEEVLVGALDDEEELGGRSRDEGPSYSEVRICDVAGGTLAERWPERHAFDREGTIADRDRQRSEIVRAFRASRGLPPVPSAWPPTARSDPARVNAAVDVWSAAAGSERVKAAAAIEAIGLGGLAAIESRIAALGKNPDAVELEKVAARVSAVVVSVAFEGGSVEPDATWRTRLGALRGKPLSVGDVTDLLTVAGTTALPAGAQGIHLRLERPSDGSGVAITVAFTRAPAAAPAGGAFDQKGRRLPSADRTVRVFLGRESIASISGNGTVDFFKKTEAHAPLANGLGRCLASPPRTSFFAIASLMIHPGDPGAGKDDGEAPAPKVAEPAKADRVDKYGDPLPPGARARFGTVRFNQAGMIWALAWTPDGKTIVTRGLGQNVRLWDAATGRERASIEGTDDSNNLALSPDGKLLATGGHRAQKMLRVFDLATGARRFEAAHPGGVEGVGFSSDGQLIATSSRDGHARLFRASTGDPLRDVAFNDDDVSQGTSIAFVPGTKTAVIASMKLGVWNTDEDVIHWFPAFKLRLYAIACSPDGKTVAVAGDDMKILLFDTAARKSLGAIEPPKEERHYSSIHTLAFSQDGKVLASNDPTSTKILRWDVATRKPLDALSGELGNVRALAFSPDGKRLAAGGDDRSLRVFDLEEEELIPACKITRGPISALALSPDEKTLAVGALGRVTLRDATTGKQLGALERGARSLAFSPDGTKLATAGSWYEVGLSDARSGRTLHVFKGHKGRYAPAVAFSPDGDTLASVGSDDGIRLWSASKKEQLREIELGEHDSATTVAFSPDGKTIAAGRRGRVTLFDTTGKEVNTFKDVVSEREYVYSLAFSPDGKILAVGSEGRLTLLDPGTGAIAHSFPFKGTVLALGFSRDSRRIAAASNSESGIAIIDVATGTDVVRLDAHPGGVSAVIFTNDGKTLYSAGDSDGTVLVWDVPEAK